MALADWVILKSSPDVVAGIDPIDTIIGTGSLRLIDFSSNTLNMFNNTYINGLTRGRIRMLIRVEDGLVSVGDDFYNIGMYVMADTPDITVPDSFGQRFYTLSLGYDLFESSHTISLDYHDNAIQDFPQNLFQTSSFNLNRGVDIVPLELEWKLEPEFGPGIIFTVRGSTTPSTQTDFSNLTQLGEIVVNNPAITLLNSVGEGIYLEGIGGSLPSGLDALIDQVSIFSLVRL